MRLFGCFVAGFLVFGSPQTSATDLDRGEELFRTECAACHSIRPNSHRTGPSLHGVCCTIKGGRCLGRYCFEHIPYQAAEVH